ncbi:hypothetical protein [Noviherbaspirillum sp. ST9]|uniref:hypothetical protein n=1 Tax=Noviherbaspirillum sp. ST9 TaxID=3401606 RepID=UPI003B58B344
MGNNSSGVQRANEESDKRREEARKQGLAEQNVTGASPPELDDIDEESETTGFAGHRVPQSPGNIASRR